MRNSLIRLTRWPVIGPLISLILVSVVVGLTTNRFWIPDNLNNLALQASIVAIVGIGSTLVIITGGIDLSPGSAIALLTMIMAQLIKTNGIPVPEAIVIVLFISALMGAFNGLLASYGRIPSFIVTLATMNIFRGIAFLFNNGSPIFSVSPSLEPWFYGKLFGVALPLFYVLIFYAVAWAFLQYTPTGRRIYAIGGNEPAARLSGIDVHQTRFLAFVFAGLTAGIASVLMTARLNSGSPNYGVGTELQAIGAAVVGGASLAGGYANIVATMVGALIIVVVQNGLNLNAVPTSWQNITLGAIIALAVLLDMWRSDLGRAAGHWFGRAFRRGQASKDGGPGAPAAKRTNRPR
ncbi:MAG: ABC transporter permease [Chloroflexi bacterium]|nr:ABC transporter permease [Chloroflexota bacterium]